jgi:exosome complex component RRP4
MFSQENDVISCEVSSFYKDGGMSVQTRSLKYGKLENGHMLSVPPHLVQRVKHHFVTLRCGVDLVVGHNGYIWVTSALTKAEGESGSEEEEEDDAGWVKCC